MRSFSSPLDMAIAYALAARDQAASTPQWAGFTPQWVALSREKVGILRRLRWADGSGSGPRCGPSRARPVFDSTRGCWADLSSRLGELSAGFFDYALESKAEAIDPEQHIWKNAKAAEAEKAAERSKFLWLGRARNCGSRAGVPAVQIAEHHHRDYAAPLQRRSSVQPVRVQQLRI